MEAIYKTLTDYIPKLNDIEYGEWNPRQQTGDGSSERPFTMPWVEYTEVVNALVRDVYAFEKVHPEFELNNYISILKKNHIQWSDEAMVNADVSKMDGKCVMALLLGAVRAERFCDGAMLSFLQRGCIQKWLERLNELDEEERRNENAK